MRSLDLLPLWKNAIMTGARINKNMDDMSKRNDPVRNFFSPTFSCFFKNSLVASFPKTSAELTIWLLSIS
jgi:hypothetical protein